MVADVTRETLSAPERSGRGGERAPERFIFVDFLRGVAAILVAYFHLQIHMVWGYPSRPIDKDSFTYHFVLGDFGLGTYGVALFFMISGFLIPSTLRGPKAQTRRFAIHRFFRLYPVYWLSIVAALSLAYLSGVHYPLRRIFANATMLQGYVGESDIVGVYWTLQIEVTFYALCVLLFWFHRLERREVLVCSLLFASLACAAARFALGRRLPVALFLGLTVMFLGDMVRAAGRGSSLRSRLPWYVALVIAAVVPTCWLAYGTMWSAYVLSYTAAIITFIVAYRAGSFFTANQSILALSIWLGEVSYSVYLFHSTIAPDLMSYLITRGVPKEVSLALSLAFAVLFSTVVFRFFERPFIELGRKLASRLPTVRTSIAASEVD